jgi:hypothetical protein
MTTNLTSTPTTPHSADSVAVPSRVKGASRRYRDGLRPPLTRAAPLRPLAAIEGGQGGKVWQSQISTLTAGFQGGDLYCLTG